MCGKILSQMFQWKFQNSLDSVFGRKRFDNFSRCPKTALRCVICYVILNSWSMILSTIDHDNDQSFGVTYMKELKWFTGNHCLTKKNDRSQWRRLVIVSPLHICLRSAHYNVSRHCPIIFINISIFIFVWLFICLFFFFTSGDLYWCSKRWPQCSY